MMDMREALKVVQSHRGDAIVIPTMQGNRAWAELTDHPDLDLPLTGCMGKASSLGLGVAMAMPRRKVIVVDGDGSLLMNLGTLVSVAEKAPENLIHLVLFNGVYAVTGGQPVPGGTFVDLAGLARDSGYRAVYEFDDLEDFASSAPEIFAQKGPVFVNLKVEAEPETLPIEQRPPMRWLPDLYSVVKKAVHKG